MIYFGTIYVYDIIELLANDDKKINKNDEDFIDILKSFKQTLILFIYLFILKDYMSYVND